MRAKVVKKTEREETVELMNISLAAEGSTASAVFHRDSCGGKLFSLRVSDVTGIIRLPEIAKLPGSAEYILGVISFRGIVLTVIDLGCFLGEERRLPGSTSQVVIVSSGETVFGISVDRASEIKEIPLRKIQLAEGEYTSGTYKLNGQEIKILDIEKMVKKRT